MRIEELILDGFKSYRESSREERSYAQPVGLMGGVCMPYSRTD